MHMPMFRKTSPGSGVAVRGGAAESASNSAAFMQLVETLRAENSAIESDNSLLRESVEDLQRAVDEMGWSPLNGIGGGTDETGMTLDTIRKLISNTRSLVAANPLVRKGVRARVGFVWGEGITVTGNRTRNIVARNDLHIFSPAACEELETALSTDGNVFFILDRGTQRIIRMPMSQVTDYIVDPIDNESIQFVLRTWNVRELNLSNNRVDNANKKVWYPVVEYVNDGGIVPAAINGAPVEQGQAVNVVSVNKQIGWLWGVPDLLSVLFWARAYKEFLEAQYTLVRSLARFAFKITDTRPKGQGAKKAAIRLAQPHNANGIDAGADMTLPGGMDLVAVNKAGANVSFDAGRPLAAMVAAGLEVPLSVLLAEAKEGTAGVEVSLDPTTVKSAQSRQRLWNTEFVRMFKYLGANTAKVQFPPIQSAPIHRVIQAIITGASSGVLFPVEVRDLIVKAMRDYGIEAKGGVPDPGVWAAYANTKQQNPGTSPQQTPDITGTGDTGRSPAGALADGDHEQRASQ